MEETKASKLDEELEEIQKPRLMKIELQEFLLDLAALQSAALQNVFLSADQVER